MKYLLILILSLFLTTNIYSQKKDAWKSIAIYSSSIILEGIGDALYDNGSKELGKSLQMVSFSFVLMSPFIMNYDKSKWYLYPIEYGFLRVALFDWTYNITRGLPVTYIGDTSVWDKFLQEVSPPDGFAFGRVVAVTVGISIPLNFINDKR